MTKGYLVMAQGNYSRQAEHLAASIKATQSSINNISIVTDQTVNHELFEHVIPLPIHDLAADADWKIHNRVEFFNLSPYQQTVILDADMLFLSDVSHWWHHFEQYQLLLTSRVKTYRKDWVTSSPYRKTFVDNNLPDVYSAFTYFSKNDFAELFFKLLKSIITNWDLYISKHAPASKQSWPSIDLAMAIAVKILGCEKEVTSQRDYPTFTHMKSGCQNWERYSEDWLSHISPHVSNKQLRLGCFVQSEILHYVIKDFVTEDILEIFK